MGDTTHILVVDDEKEIRDNITDYFEIHGFKVHGAADGEEMRGIVDREPISIVILDLRLPGEDGFVLCRELSKRPQLGVIMLTGSTETVDKVVGLEMGADDYVAKPFELRELLARVKSLLRRLSQAPAEEDSPELREVAVGDFILGIDDRTLRDAEGNHLPLTSMEYDLLRVFVEHPNKVLNRDQLLDLAHNRSWDPFDRSIDVRITRLRKKIEPDPNTPRLIKTVRGVGYVYVPVRR